MTVTFAQVRAATAALEAATRAFVAQHAGSEFVFTIDGTDESGRRWSPELVRLIDVHPDSGMVRLEHHDGWITPMTIWEFAFEYGRGRRLRRVE